MHFYAKRSAKQKVHRRIQAKGYRNNVAGGLSYREAVRKYEIPDHKLTTSTDLDCPRRPSYVGRILRTLLMKDVIFQNVSLAETKRITVLR